MKSIKSAISFKLGRRRTGALAALCGVAASIAIALCPATAPAAEPAACLGFDPSKWPAPSRPYFMIGFDTSGSMTSSVATTNSCGYPNNRLGHGRCAVKNTFLAFGGQVNFGLASFRHFMTGCASMVCYSGCTFSADNGCGPEPSCGLPNSGCREGANILVPMLQDNYFNPPPIPSNIPELLSWVDNDCTNGKELFGNGGTPLNGMLRDFYRYFSDKWALGLLTYPSPLANQSQGERPCRSVNVILVTDGDESCDADPDDPIDAAGDLWNGFQKGDIYWKVRTHIINFAGGNPATAMQIAAAGNGTAQLATDEASLSAALANIINTAVKPETCDNADNNCNGCTDEGFKHYCDMQPNPSNCCAWTTDAERDSCLASYQASIPLMPPQGDLTLLPCTTVAQQKDPKYWLCYDPKEQCDGVDNNCQGGIDDNVITCGNPPHCPTAEVCNQIDDDCNGVADDGLSCMCIPSPEICDGCDNDCNGIADDGIVDIPCGLLTPPNCLGTLSCKPPAPVPPGGCVPGGGYDTCSNSPQTEVCDGLDNDCDDSVDEGIAPVPCAPPNTPGGLMYGPPSQCRMGIEPCNGTCQGFIGPSLEVCDGIDNDCDGQVDEGSFGAGKPCGVNQPPCVPGTTACVNGALVCQGGTLPQPEVCDGVDNDCDAQIDEAPLSDAPSGSQNGCWTLDPAACCPGPNCCTFQNLSWCAPPGANCVGPGTLAPPCNNGTLTCTGTQGWACTGPKEPIPESCDGLDNDCNGLIDDGSLPGVGQTCGSDVGECQPGLTACTSGVLDCVGDIPPSPELCDGLDNDCDAAIDNGISTGGTCAVPYDMTLYPGDRTHPPCQPGIVQCNGMGGTTCIGGIGPSPEVCDGIDNDCDGTIDETGAPPDGVDGTANPLPPPNANLGDACGVDIGECKAGMMACINGTFACLGGQAPSPEECDCADNDCNGVTDNPNTNSTPPLCSTGKDCVQSSAGCQCAEKCGQGEFQCPPGQVCEVVTSSETGQPLGNYCIPDSCAGGCADKEVKDANNNIVCAPEGTELPGCIQPPVCECKGQAGCQKPCWNVTCPMGLVCTDYGPNAGTCVADNCYHLPCQGCDRVCNLGTCVDNPCEPNPCMPDEVCKPNGDFTMYSCTGSCAGINCPAGAACKDGTCAPTCDPPCAAGQACNDSTSTPACVPAHSCVNSGCAGGGCCDPVSGCGNCPCEGVVCPDGQQCEGGECEPSMGTGGSGTGSATGTGNAAGGGSATAAGQGGGDQNNGVWGLPTGGGGCSCTLGPGASQSAYGRLALCALALGALLRRRRGPKARAKVPAAAARGIFAATAIVTALVATGCQDTAYCFDDCAGDTEPTATASSSSGSGGEGGGCLFNCAGVGGASSASGAGGGPCVETNGSIEICDGIDNDCNGAVDDGPDIDFTSPKSCGSCSNNCYTTLLNCKIDTITCEAPSTCQCGECAADYYDLDTNGTCEYYCIQTAGDDSACNHKDDDCDGIKDEDVDLCTSTTDCGKCGGNCVILNGEPECVHTGPPPCDTSNTQCQIKACHPGYYDLDNSAATGCEYQCTLTNGGIEICDGLDNDCDGKIDAADDLSGDPVIGSTCYGDPDGECASPQHAGSYACQGGQPVCIGPDVLVENQQPELCNGKDDDCDGQTDESATDVGMPCGTSNIFPCSFGTTQCHSGAPVCIGAVEPGIETCNGQDDDCDGTIDLSNGNPPADSVGPCDIPPPPPMGATSPCMAGTKACIAGSIACQGSVGPTSMTDGCGDDSNCDGVLSNQPDLMTDVNHCGSCANDCDSGSVHAYWGCSGGACEFLGCEPGYYDLDSDHKCEYACIYIGPVETCNGADDNCNGQTDEGVLPPSPVQVCGVSPAASRPECMPPAVTVACAGGAWSCTFPAGVCNPSCAGATEICDNLDNDCDGALDENVPNIGKPCASDDGLPPPGHGACRTFGTYVCKDSVSSQCSALPVDCSTLPGGCTELCDGVDNDCDGSVDEPFSAKGNNATYFVKPIVTKVTASLWISSYEASRPSATNIVPGTGNGYHTSAPPGITLDKTPACSAPGKIPWFNVSPQEVEQTCAARGGSICSTADWQAACKMPVPCKWGYSPLSGCNTPAVGSKYCNLSNTFDFDINQPGNQDGLLTTASPLLGNCAADWSPQGTPNVFDLTGNLREVTKDGSQYHLMGGAFNTQAEDGAACGFTFYTVDDSFKFYDTGFRCCFSSDPAL